jgi:hypothetical protein
MIYSQPNTSISHFVTNFIHFPSILTFDTSIFYGSALMVCKHTLGQARNCSFPSEKKVLSRLMRCRRGTATRDMRRRYGDTKCCGIKFYGSTRIDKTSEASIRRASFSHASSFVSLSLSFFMSAHCDHLRSSGNCEERGIEREVQNQKPPHTAIEKWFKVRHMSDKRQRRAKLNRQRVNGRGRLS